MAKLDQNHIVCGQMNGWIDVVEIETGNIVISKELKHITGNITIIHRTERTSEIMLGTQRGVYFAYIGRGLGLMEVEMERFNKDKQSSYRDKETSQFAEVTTQGPKLTDLEGMSQMSFKSKSQFGGVRDGDESQNVHSVYTKPFTV